MTLVREFHLAFGHPVEICPTVPTLEQRMLRVRMLAEELTELADAFGVALRIERNWDDGDTWSVDVAKGTDKVDLVEAADALGDIRYVAEGGNLIIGVDGDAVYEEIHRSNMSKLGADGKPLFRADGKTLKGPNYTRPDIVAAISQGSFRYGNQLVPQSIAQVRTRIYGSGPTEQGEHA